MRNLLLLLLSAPYGKEVTVSLCLYVYSTCSTKQLFHVPRKMCPRRADLCALRKLVLHVLLSMWCSMSSMTAALCTPGEQPLPTSCSMLHSMYSRQQLLHVLWDSSCSMCSAEFPIPIFIDCPCTDLVEHVSECNGASSTCMHALLCASMLLSVINYTNFYWQLKYIWLKPAPLTSVAIVCTN